MTQRFTVLSLTRTTPFDDDADGEFIILQSMMGSAYSTLFGSAYVRPRESLAALCVHARNGDLRATDERLNRQLSLVHRLTETDLAIVSGGHYETRNSILHFSTGEHQQLPGMHAKELAEFLPAVREYSAQHWPRTIEAFAYSLPMLVGYSPEGAQPIPLPISIKR